MNTRGKLEIGITIIIMILIILFTNVISFANEIIIIQNPDISFLTEFLNTSMFFIISILIFLFLFPFLILSESKEKSRRRR